MGAGQLVLPVPSPPLTPPSLSHHTLCYQLSFQLTPFSPPPPLPLPHSHLFSLHLLHSHLSPHLSLILSPPVTQPITSSPSIHFPTHHLSHRRGPADAPFLPSLFPTMPRHNFHKVAPLVRSLCAKHGIEYQEKPLLRALQDIVRCGETGRDGHTWEVPGVPRGF